MIKLVSKGSWKKTEGWLKKAMRHGSYLQVLRKYGQRGVEALKRNTPVLTGETAESWYYDIEEDKKQGLYRLYWCNRNLVDEWFNLALFIQLGHGTKDGYWVEGIDYINPALRPIFNEMAEQVWDEVNDPSYYTPIKIN